MFQEIIKKAWENTWKNKFLWFFGLLIFLFSESWGLNLFLNYFKILTNQQNNSYLNIDKIQLFIEKFKILFINHPLNLFVFVLISIVIFLIIVFISLSSQGGIIYCSQKLSQTKKTNFLEGIKIGIKNFKPLLLVFILSGLFVFVLFLIFVLPFIVLFIKNGLLLWFFIALLTSLLIILPLSILTYLITRFAYSYVILKNKTPISSIKEGIKLFLNNWLITLKIGVFIFISYLLVIMIMAFIISLINLPFFFISILLNYLTSSDVFWVVILINEVVITFLSLIIISILKTFHYNLWVFLFNKLID